MGSHISSLEKRLKKTESASFEKEVFDPEKCKYKQQSSVNSKNKSVGILNFDINLSNWQVPLKNWILNYFELVKHIMIIFEKKTKELINLELGGLMRAKTRPWIRYNPLGRIDFRHNSPFILESHSSIKMYLCQINWQACFEELIKMFGTKKLQRNHIFAAYHDLWNKFSFSGFKTTIFSKHQELSINGMRER